MQRDIKILNWQQDQKDKIFQTLTQEECEIEEATMTHERLIKLAMRETRIKTLPNVKMP